MFGPALAFLHFESQAYLSLLAVIPILILMTRRSLAGLGRVRRTLAVALRCLVVVVIVFALAGAQAVRKTRDLAVIYLFDRSQSVPSDLSAQAFEAVRRAAEQPRADDRIAVVAFDGQSAVEQLPMAAFAVTRITEAVQPEQTDIAAALRMGMALFPPEMARRAVLISDGNENVGELLEEADNFRAAGVPVDVIPLRYQHANEVIFEQLKTPPLAGLDETINLQMLLRSERRVSGRIRLYHDDELVDLGAAEKVTLEPGPTRLTVPIALREAKAHRFRAVFEPDQAALDTIAANNEGRAFTIVAGEGRILILTTPEDAASAEVLAGALRREQLKVEVEIAGTNPLDQARLLAYSLVILSNVPANYIPAEWQEALASFVRDLGGGLAMIGGDESFGAGGWMSTPIEDVMPVSFDVKSKKQIPKGALVLVMHACEIPRGNYWGERVAIEAVKTLSSRDLVGVLSYQWLSADKRNWVVPLRTVGNKADVINAIRKMEMGDMPSLEEVMTDGVKALQGRSDAAAKHMIVISDFDPAGPSPELLRSMKDSRISCSTVAIGFGGHMIDEKKAADVAVSTGGKYYRTNNFAELPQIFIKESRIVRRSLINESTFQPRVASGLTATVAGLVGQALPTLDGYVVTTPKPLAEIPLTRPTEDGDDPLLAHWQVGLGKTVAFTSGMWPRWGTAWAGWPSFSKLWAQIARWAARPAEESFFDINVAQQGSQATLRIDALDKNAATLDFLNLSGMLVGPDFKSAALRLEQVGPGRYETTFDARQPGSYVVNLDYRTADGRRASLRTGLSVAYSPEYRNLETNLPLLHELAQRTGGRVLEPEAAAATLDPQSLPSAEVRRAIWEDLIRLMLALFLLDVAVRRIAVNPLAALRRARQFLAEMAGARRPAEASAAVLSTLKGTRERVAEQLTKPPAGPAPDRAARYDAPSTPGRVSAELDQALDGNGPERPVVAPPTPRPATDADDYTSRLREAKRRAREQREADNEPGT